MIARAFAREDGDGWLVALAVLGTVYAVYLALVTLGGIPHVQDEVVYQLQADTLASGRLWGDALEPWAAHQLEFVINRDGRRFGAFPNGWPVVLAVGSALGVPWLINPLLHGATAFVSGRLGRRLGGRGAGVVTAAVLALNPALLTLAATRMSHTLCAFLVVVVVAVLSRREVERVHALVVGAAVGWLGFARPLDGGLALVGVAIWIAAFRRDELRVWCWALLPLAGSAALIAAQNLAYTGSPFRFAMRVWFQPEHAPAPGAFRYTAGCSRLGFGDDVGCFQTLGPGGRSFGHTPAKAWIATRHRVGVAGPLWFAAWPFGLFAAGLLLRRPTRRFLLGAFAAVLACVLGYALYWYHGVCYGARFYHSAAPLAILAAALGFHVLVARYRTTVFTALPFVVFGLAHMPEVRAELDGYWGVDTRMEEVAAALDDEPTLVLVAWERPRGRWLPMRATSHDLLLTTAVTMRGMYATKNEGQVVFAEFRPSLLAETLAHYPNRRVRIATISAEPQTVEVETLDVEAILARVPQRSDLPAPVPLPPARSP